MRTHGPWMMAFALVAVGGCRENPAIDPNNAPEAVAWIDDPGHPIPVDERGAIDEGVRALGIALAYDGSPLTVTLDATASSDRDGEVVSYVWLSGNFGAGCMGRDDAPGHDPNDEARASVTLDEGFWEFALWVEDDLGDVSDQSVVTIRVGANSADPCSEGPGSTVVGDEDAGARSDLP